MLMGCFRKISLDVDLIHNKGYNIENLLKTQDVDFSKGTVKM